MSVQEELVTLWRPTGPQELALVAESGWRAWPPRLPEQPIFYPVLNADYATKIARDWNVPHSYGSRPRFPPRRGAFETISHLAGREIDEAGSSVTGFDLHICQVEFNSLI